MYRPSAILAAPLIALAFILGPTSLALALDSDQSPTTEVTPPPETPEITGDEQAFECKKSWSFKRCTFERFYWQRCRYWYARSDCKTLVKRCGYPYSEQIPDDKVLERPKTLTSDTDSSDIPYRPDEAEQEQLKSRYQTCRAHLDDDLESQAHYRDYYQHSVPYIYPYPYIYPGDSYRYRQRFHRRKKHGHRRIHRKKHHHIKHHHPEVKDRGSKPVGKKTEKRPLRRRRLAPQSPNRRPALQQRSNPFQERPTRRSRRRAPERQTTPNQTQSPQQRLRQPAAQRTNRRPNAFQQRQRVRNSRQRGSYHQQRDRRQRRN